MNIFSAAIAQASYYFSVSQNIHYYFS